MGCIQWGGKTEEVKETHQGEVTVLGLKEKTYVIRFYVGNFSLETLGSQAVMVLAFNSSTHEAQAGEIS